LFSFSSFLQIRVATNILRFFVSFSLWLLLRFFIQFLKRQTALCPIFTYALLALFCTFSVIYAIFTLNISASLPQIHALLAQFLRFYERKIAQCVCGEMLFRDLSTYTFLILQFSCFFPNFLFVLSLLFGFLIARNSYDL